MDNIFSTKNEGNLRAKHFVLVLSASLASS